VARICIVELETTDIRVFPRGRDRLQPQISITSNNKAAAHRTEKAAKALNWPRMTMIRRTVHSAKRNSSKRREKIDINGLQVRHSYCGAQVIVQRRFDNDSSTTTISIIGVIGAVHSISMNPKKRTAG